METIWKYPVEVNQTIEIDLPAGSEILTVQVQNGEPCIWAIVNPEALLEKRTFLMVGTGHPFDNTVLFHIGSFQLNSGQLVFHLFEQVL